MRQRVKPWTRWHGGILVPSMSGVGTVTLPVPDAPVIAADTLSSSSIEITLVSGEGDVFEIERSLNSSDWTQISADASFPYPATGLSASTLYYFRCRAQFTGGSWSEWSEVVSDTTEAGGEDADPTPGGGDTIIWDTRAGGAQSYQSMSNLSQIHALFGPGIRNSGGASQFFSTDVDGIGTNARGCQWTATANEQECMVGTEGSVVPGTPSANTGWYTQFKFRLGRSSTGGGSGTIDQWILSEGNPHHMIFIWGRGTGSHRLYMMITPSQTNIRSDGLNYNSPVFSVNPYGRTGTQKMTVYIRPTGGIVRAWLKGMQILDASG